MKLLEIIELRTSPHNQKSVGERLSDLLTDINACQEVRAAASFQHKYLETDFSIHIQYSSHASETVARLGKQLASALKELGIINHSVWEERI